MSAIAEFTVQLHGVPALPDTMEGAEFLNEQGKFFRQYAQLLMRTMQLERVTVSDRLFYPPVTDEDEFTCPRCGFEFTEEEEEQARKEDEGGLSMMEAAEQLHKSRYQNPYEDGL